MIRPVFAVLYILFCHDLFVQGAAPPVLNPHSAATLDLYPNISTANSLTNTLPRRVPNTSTFLALNILTPPIPRPLLARTLLRAQASLRTFIATHDAADTPLAPADDPYLSDERWEGCYFGVAEFPHGSRLLTYGVVYDVLEGLRLWLYMDRMERAAVFEVRREAFGGVGVGRVSAVKPEEVREVGWGGGKGG